MEDRTVIQWDKDDLEALGLLKVDVLALGMLTAIRMALDMVNRRRGRSLTMAGILAAEDQDEGKPVYEMLCRADSIGVFQVESRAQMSMLPRLQPAIITIWWSKSPSCGRVRSRAAWCILTCAAGKDPEKVEYPSAELKEVLKRTLGVPISRNRSWRSPWLPPGSRLARPTSCGGRWRPGRERAGSSRSRSELVNGMREERLQREIRPADFRADQGFRRIRFPGIAFRQFRAAGLCLGMAQVLRAGRLHLRAAQQPADGLLPAAQLVQDAQRHGVEVRPVDVLKSEWDCTLETGPQGRGPRSE